jgi:hypothetical protein
MAWISEFSVSFGSELKTHGKYERLFANLERTNGKDIVSRACDFWLPKIENYVSESLTRAGIRNVGQLQSWLLKIQSQIPIFLLLNKAFFQSKVIDVISPERRFGLNDLFPFCNES